MNKFILAIITVLLTTLMWLTSEDFYLTGLTLIMAFGLFMIIIPKQLDQFAKHRRISQEMFHFINGFIIALSVKKTMAPALESLEGQLSGPLKHRIANVDTSDTFQLLSQLKTYFVSVHYEMFLTIIDLHATQGGSILQMSQLLLMSLRHLTTDYDERILIGRRKLTNFVILWVLTIVVLLFSRFGISVLYRDMMGSLIFKCGLSGYFLFLMFSLYIWVSRFMKVTTNV